MGGLYESGWLVTSSNRPEVGQAKNSEFNVERIAPKKVTSQHKPSLVVTALSPISRGQPGRNLGDNDDTTRHLSGRPVPPQAWRRWTCRAVVCTEAEAFVCWHSASHFVCFVCFCFSSFRIRGTFGQNRGPKEDYRSKRRTRRCSMKATKMVGATGFEPASAC